MKLKEILNYIAGFLVGGIITVQFIKEFNPNDIMSWLFLIPIIGYNVLLLIHLIIRIRAENSDD
jgi:hypothetical protein